MASAKIRAVKPQAAKSRDLAAARRVLKHATEALDALGESLNGDFSRAIDAILAVEGRVIVSGMGKSGHVARKIAATLASTGTPALFLHPAEASHGDLGMVTRADAVLMLSNSGETAELADIITYVRRLAIPLIGMANNPESKLLQASDVSLLLPKSQEACPMGLAPTTSTTMMLALGDALAVALMERRGFSADQYRDFHPGGSLGKKLIRVGDIMHKEEELPLVAPDARMRDVLIVMTSARFGIAGYAGVVDKKGALLGIITDGDLRRNMAPDLLDKLARDVMTANPKTVSPDILASEALTFMNAKPPKVTYLFVVDPTDESRKPVGFLSVHDILRAGLS
ncbi:MAG: KpsF/GutQ family sugar-phosphate isomerase [Alphaproteobacteria bacterium]|nr:KpsF/GutQ family sugar-phosphate isomerase [Alphaproteobacteria bacterium]MBL7097028.1 KpsF/GutQ family sugar-phosphate isomerase [Alphaproteobacteria bacterium]